MNEERFWLTAKLNLFTTEDAAHSSWEGLIKTGVKIIKNFIVI